MKEIAGIVPSLVLLYVEVKIADAVFEAFGKLFAGDPIGSLLIFILNILGLLVIPFAIYTILKTAFSD